MNRILKHTDLVIFLKKTGSTMSDAMEVLSSMKPQVENLLVVAEEQISGVGRNQNCWVSPAGGLWFTYCLKTEQVTHQITLLLGLCLHKVLENQYPDLKGKLQIKWPNDLVFDNKKLSGILVQSQKGYLCIGIGINTNPNAVKLKTAIPPVSLKQILSFDVSNRALLNDFLTEFHNMYPIYQSAGIRPFCDEINSLLYGLNKELEFDNDKNVIKAICRGISEEGAILLEQADGSVFPCYSGSINNCSD